MLEWGPPVRALVVVTQGVANQNPKTKPAPGAQGLRGRRLGLAGSAGVLGSPRAGRNGWGHLRRPWVLRLLLLQARLLDQSSPGLHCGTCSKSTFFAAARSHVSRRPTRGTDCVLPTIPNSAVVIEFVAPSQEIRAEPLTLGAYNHAREVMRNHETIMASLTLLNAAVATHGTRAPPRTVRAWPKQIIIDMVTSTTARRSKETRRTGRSPSMTAFWQKTRCLRGCERVHIHTVVKLNQGFTRL